MRTRSCLLLLLLVSCIGLEGSARAQQSTTEVGRKILRRVDPIYPEMARKANLNGTVKVIAVVAPDGKVKSVEPVGGSPLLVQASQDAIKQWKFAPAAAESREMVELHFHPQ